MPLEPARPNESEPAFVVAVPPAVSPLGLANRPSPLPAGWPPRVYPWPLTTVPPGAPVRSRTTMNVWPQ